MLHSSNVTYIRIRDHVNNTASSDPWRPSATVSAVKRSADMIAKNQALERPCQWRNPTQCLLTSKKYVLCMDGQSSAILYDHESIKHLYKLLDYKLKTLLTSSHPILVVREKHPEADSSFLQIDVSSIIFPIAILNLWSDVKELSFKTLHLLIISSVL